LTALVLNNNASILNQLLEPHIIVPSPLWLADAVPLAKQRERSGDLVATATFKFRIISTRQHITKQGTSPRDPAFPEPGEGPNPSYWLAAKA